MTSKFSIDNRELLQRISSGEAVVGIDFGYLIVRELAAFRLAAMDSESVGTLSVRHMSYSGKKIGNQFGFVHSDAAMTIAEGDYPLYRHAQPAPEYERVKRFNADQMHRICLEANRHLDKYGAMAKEVNKLLGRIPAQPAPVVTFYRDGIEAAAKWIDQQREAYDSEHGRHDLDTGSFEFGNDAQREYSSTLEELAEGIRALHPNAGNSPVIPDGYVIVPREPTEEMIAAAMNCEDVLFNSDDSFCVQFGNIYEAMLAAAPQEDINALISLVSRDEQEGK